MALKGWKLTKNKTSGFIGWTEEESKGTKAENIEIAKNYMRKHSRG